MSALRVLTTTTLLSLLPAISMAQDSSVASQEKSITGGTLMLITYLILWVLLIGFFVFILSKQRQAEADLKGMEARVAAALRKAEGEP